MVLLDSAGRYSRVADAERIRRWLDAMPPESVTADAVAPQVPSAQVPSAPVTEGEGDLGRSGSDSF
jgi:D-alanyl-D-alanine endopeptidase (penicillin-binding protein 7)